MRGNNVMLGYYREPEATEVAFRGGWFHSGDLAVMHPDGYIEIRDRAKDIIISGGENISSVEVERVLYEHPAVLEAAIVARHDEKWGEVPHAYVLLKEDAVDHRRGADRILPRPPGALQVSEGGTLWSVAQNIHRENPQECAASADARRCGKRSLVHAVPEHLVRKRRPDRNRHSQPSAAAQRAIAGADDRAHRVPQRNRPRPLAASRDSGRGGKGLLLRPRPERDGWPRHQSTTARSSTSAPS